MTENEKPKFVSAISGIAAFYGTELPQASVAIYWKALREFGLAEIDRALSAHIVNTERGRFMPKPADIIEQLPSQSRLSQMGPDAAWELAMHLGIGDEDATVVAPKAILRAFPYSLWNDGDKIAARMAFKDAFPEAARRHGMRYQVSEGNDPNRREPAILEALRNGLIASGTAQHLLPNLPPERFAIEDMTKVNVRENLPA